MTAAIAAVAFKVPPFEITPRNWGAKQAAGYRWVRNIEWPHNGDGEPTAAERSRLEWVVNDTIAAGKVDIVLGSAIHPDDMKPSDSTTPHPRLRGVYARG
ncbi:hypothetical protein HJC99_02395 [Candidatus Saccharibacteria bacterium]|nr:hypothetical protein [Candidatus Saccharibacteria bacterium]